MKSVKLFWWRFRKKLGSPKLLCDTCRFDYHTACTNPDRPNAISCPDYKPR